VEVFLLLLQMGRLMGVADGDSITDQLLGKVEAMLGVVRKVNEQFQDASLTTFVCVCIPEFLSLYETERLVQELARYGIDVRNIVINQVIFPEAGEVAGRRWWREGEGWVGVSRRQAGSNREYQQGNLEAVAQLLRQH
jgi:anion-transporting  ArsA/GET3 family ATPase